MSFRVFKLNPRKRGEIQKPESYGKTHLKTRKLWENPKTWGNRKTRKRWEKPENRGKNRNIEQKSENLAKKPGNRGKNPKTLGKTRKPWEKARKPWEFTFERTKSENLGQNPLRAKKPENHCKTSKNYMIILNIK